MDENKINLKDWVNKMVDGNVSTTKDGDAYVKVPELEYESVFVLAKYLNTALQGDNVKVLIVGVDEDGAYGKIESINSRSRKAYVGVLAKEDDKYLLIPHDSKIYIKIYVNKETIDNEDLILGKKVAVEVLEWRDDGTAYGVIVKNLGTPGENNAEMLAYAIERGFSDEHKRNTQEEADLIKANGISDKDFVGRRDMRGILTFTIDPADAKDFDDAISYQILPNGNLEVGVHIADVSYYVKPGSSLDAEAIERETSVYLVDRCVPMLPEVLSNDLCSLVEGENRLVMSAIFELDTEANILNEWFGRCVIKSNKRFTYEEAQQSMDNGLLGKEGLYSTELNNLNRLAKIMYRKRLEAGALVLDSEEVKFKLDENGKPVDVYIKTRQDVHKLIEEFMLLANRKVSEFITNSQKENNPEIKKPICIYRIHDKPDSDKMHDLNLFIKALGERVTFKDGVIPTQDINNLLAKFEGRPEKDLLTSKVTRAMQKAIYSVDNVGHYGLAFEYYTHFTSPIRRYPDVLAHRLLQGILDGNYPKEEYRVELMKLCAHASLREKEASDAERGSIKYKQVEYMQDRVGQKFIGVVSGVAKFGIYVEEERTKCEGFIRLRDLGDDFFNYNDKTQSIIGERTGKEFRIGDKINIQVTEANLELRQLNYKIV